LRPQARPPWPPCAPAREKCLHAACLEYHWNGKGIDAVFEVNQLA
jgi:hypothetical protein